MLSEGQEVLPRILVLGYRKFSELMNAVAAEFRGRADIRILEYLLAAEVDLRELVGRHGAHAVVSAGANAAYLAATLELPVLSLEISDADCVEAIAKARALGRRILVIGHGDEYPALHGLARLAGVEIEYRGYQTIDEAREQVLLAARDAPRVVVGSSLVCELAEREGLPAILLYSRASCRRLLERALALLAQQAERRQRDAWHAALFQDERLPTVLLGPDGEVREYNACAARSFRLDAGGRAPLQRALEGAGRGVVQLDEQRWQVSRSEARADGAPLGEVVRFMPEQPAVPRGGRPGSARRLVFASAEMRRIDELIPAYAAARGTVLIQGESGTGKELVAHRLYRDSAYARGEIVAVNCGAIPEELFESELFGYVEGAFTGSRRGGRRGLFELANHGVIFLDEIGEMPLGQQAKLLRVLEERRLRALGSNREIALDLKVIAATNGDLRARIREGRFREDLFYRLNVFSLRLPPLRERPEDIGEIARYLFGEYAAVHGVALDGAQLFEQLREQFLRYPWPGNVRELENFVERIVVGVGRLGGVAALRDALPQLLPELGTALHEEPEAAPGGALRAHEQRLIRDAMQRFDNDRTRVAEYLGISQTTLWRRLRELNGVAE